MSGMSVLFVIMQRRAFSSANQLIGQTIVWCQFIKIDLMSMNYEILNDASHCINWIIEIYQCLEIDDGYSMHVAHRSLLMAHWYRNNLLYAHVLYINVWDKHIFTKNGQSAHSNWMWTIQKNAVKCDVIVMGRHRAIAMPHSIKCPLIDLNGVLLQRNKDGMKCKWVLNHEWCISGTSSQSKCIHFLLNIIPLIPLNSDLQQTSIERRCVHWHCMHCLFAQSFLLSYIFQFFLFI